MGKRQSRAGDQLAGQGTEDGAPEARDPSPTKVSKRLARAQRSAARAAARAAKAAEKAELAAHRVADIAERDAAKRARQDARASGDGPKHGKSGDGRKRRLPRRVAARVASAAAGGAGRVLEDVAGLVRHAAEPAAAVVTRRDPSPHEGSGTGASENGTRAGDEPGVKRATDTGEGQG